MTRTLAYFIAQVNSSKQVDIKSIMPFEWDKAEKITTVSEEDRERLIKKAKSYGINGQGSSPLNEGRGQGT